jgi:hypothetical protein
MWASKEHRILGVKFVRKRPFRQEKNPTDHREIDSEDGKWTEIARDRVKWRRLLLQTRRLPGPLADI